MDPIDIGCDTNPLPTQGYTPTLCKQFGLQSASVRTIRRLAIRAASFMSYLPTLLALIAAFCCLAEVASPVG
jgi:hypothetical protein